MRFPDLKLLGFLRNLTTMLWDNIMVLSSILMEVLPHYRLHPTLTQKFSLVQFQSFSLHLIKFSFSLCLDER